LGFTRASGAYGQGVRNAGEVILNGLKGYVKEVSEKSFPQPENWFTMPDEEYDELEEMLD